MVNLDILVFALVQPDVLLLSALLVEREPANLQAQSLGTLIDNGIAKGQ